MPEFDRDADILRREQQLSGCGPGGEEDSFDDGQDGHDIPGSYPENIAFAAREDVLSCLEDIGGPEQIVGVLTISPGDK